MTKSPEEIEQDIEETRLAVDRTVEALREKISPDNLAGEFVRAVRGGGEHLVNAGVRQVRKHPLQFAVLGAGVAWLALRMRKRAEPHLIEPPIEPVDRARPDHALAKAIGEDPFIAGALALALGAAIGAALPSTRFENRYLGRVRSDAIGKVRGLAEQKLAEVQDAVAGKAESRKGAPLQPTNDTRH